MSIPRSLRWLAALALLAALISIRIAVSVALIEIVLGAVGGNLLGMAPNDWVNYLAGVGAIVGFASALEAKPEAPIVIAVESLVIFRILNR